MPPTQVIFFAEDDGTAPALSWLDSLPTKVRDKCIVRIERLGECGHELRRPEAEYLRDDIYELRVRSMRVNYRILYFFHEGQAVVTHGLTKEKEVPDSEISRAIHRRQLYLRDPSKHTYTE